MMETFRNNPPKDLAGEKVVLIKDFKLLKQTDANGKQTPIEMPATSNVLQFYSEGGIKVSVRPSGTEPKIKFYCEVPAQFDGKDYDAACAAADKKLEVICKSLGI